MSSQTAVQVCKEWIWHLQFFITKQLILIGGCEQQWCWCQYRGQVGSQDRIAEKSPGGGTNDNINVFYSSCRGVSKPSWLVLSLFSAQVFPCLNFNWSRIWWRPLVSSFQFAMVCSDIDCIIHECKPRILSKTKREPWWCHSDFKTAGPPSSELADNKPVRQRMGSSSLTSWVGLLRQKQQWRPDNASWHD